MTVTPIAPTDPLSGPSHAGQHNALNGSVANLTATVKTLTDAVPGNAEAVQQARRAAHEWVIRGPLITGSDLLLPVLWNMTGHPVQYEAAKLTVYTPPADTDIIVDIVTGSGVASGQYDEGTMTTILAEKLVIPAGEHESRFYYGLALGDDFVGEQAVENFLAAYVYQVGSEAGPGADLTIQLNRLL